MAGLLTRSDLILRPQLLITSPAKSFYPAARVCFGRNTNSSSGVDRRLVLSVPPHHKLNNVNYYAPDSKEINKPFVVVYNNHQSIINSSNSISVHNRLVEIKKTVVNTLASLFLFGIVFFLTTPALQPSVSYAAAAALSTSSLTSSTPSSSSSSSTPKFEIILSSPISGTVESIVFITLLLFTIPLTLALLTGFKYFLQLFKSDKKTLLMLQIGVLDKTRNLQRLLTQIADSSNSDCLKLQEVVNEVLQRYASCHFAYLSATKCLSDEEKKYSDIFAEMMRSICVNPPALVKAYHVFTFYVKSLAIFIHGVSKMAIKKIRYDDKCSKQLFGEVLNRELVRYGRDEETFANVNGVKYEKEAVGITHSMVDNDYTVVTILVLASGTYSIPSLVGITEHVNTVLQKFNTIPKSEIETLEILRTPQTEDQGLSEQELQQNFPLLKPVN